MDSLVNIISDSSIVPDSVVDLTNLTIVIPTYERPAYLLRQIAYLSEWKTQVEIVDGSAQPLDSEIIKLIEKFPHINYLHCRASYTERVFLACERIKTPYAMCLADDDFYLQSGLVSAIKKLESDGNAVACMGQSLGFDKFNQDYYYFLYGSNLRNYAVNAASADRRIADGIKNYRSATSYAVFRTPAFLKVWAKRENMSCLEAVEYEHAIRTYLCGGLITTPAIYWLRSFETQPVASAIDGNRAIDFAKWYNDVKFNGECESFKLRIQGIFLADGSLNKIEADALYNLIIQLILAKSHASLSDQNITITIVERLLKIVYAVSSNNLNGLKRTPAWQAIRAAVFHFSRKKVHGREVGNSAEERELSKVLEFASLFAIQMKKRGDDGYIWKVKP